MTVRIALAQDVVAIAAQHATCFDVGWDQNTLGDMISSDLVLVWCDRDWGVIKGFIIVRRVLDEAEILTLAVDPSGRLKGIASALLRAAEKALVQTGISRIFLEVAADNVAALALYQRASFTQIALRKGYYKRQLGQTIDALVMSRDV